MKEPSSYCMEYKPSSDDSLELPYDELSESEEETLLMKAGDEKVALPFTSCKCLCNKNCDCGKNSDFSLESTKSESCCRCNLCSCLRRMNKVVLLFGLIFSLLLLIFSLFFIESWMQGLVEGQLVLKEGTDRFTAWTNGEPPVLYKIWVFNITNGNYFMKGARPLVREAGPYVYEVREKREKVSFDDPDLLTFYPFPIFKFMPHLSVGTEDDVITTLNVPLVNAGIEVQGSVVLQNVLRIASKIHNFRSLRKLTVGELLWGHKSGVLDWARKFKDVPYPHKNFGLMAGKNSTLQTPYTINTGASDISQILAVQLYGGKSSLGVWGSEICDRVRGSLIGGFHPGVLPSETLSIFTGQMCRSLPLIFEKNLTHSGLEAFRFIPPPYTFAYDNSNPLNQCFCEDDDCPPRGVLDVRGCYFGAAIAFSFPHFYQGDPVLRHVVRGLSPDPELHGTQFDIYPALGVPLRVKLRMQMNVVIDGNQELQRARHFDIVFPVFWFEAGIDSLPGEMVGMLKMAQDLPSVVKTTSVTVCAALTALFLLLLLASAFAGWCGITPHSSRTQTPDHLPDNAPHWPPVVNHNHHPPQIIDTSTGSLGSLGHDDPYRGAVVVVPAYRSKSFFPNGDVVTDGFPSSAAAAVTAAPPSGFEAESDEDDRPPAYTSVPNTTKASSSSLLSVEIHKSASLNTVNTPPTPPEADEDEFLKKRETPDSGERSFEEESPQKANPPTPPPSTPESPALASLAVDENGPSETTSTPADGCDQNLLATTSPLDSPNEHVVPSAPSLPRYERKGFYSPSTDPRPPPLQSDL